MSSLKSRGLPFPQPGPGLAAQMQALLMPRDGKPATGLATQVDDFLGPPPKGPATGSPGWSTGPPSKGAVAEIAAHIADRLVELLQVEIIAGDDQVFDTKASARIVGLSPRSLEAMRADGSGPVCIRLTGSSIGYTLGALRAWLRSRPTYGRRALANSLARVDPSEGPLG